MSKQAEAVDLLRAMSAEDLEEHLRQQRRRLFEVRFQQAAGQVENHRQVREIRREIARTMTLQVELARGHHLASDLVVEEEPEEQPRPRRLRRARRAEAPESGAEPVEAMPGDVAPAVEPEADADQQAEAAAATELEPDEEAGVDREAALDLEEVGEEGSDAPVTGAEDPDEDETR